MHFPNKRVLSPKSDCSWLETWYAWYTHKCFSSSLRLLLMPPVMVPSGAAASSSTTFIDVLVEWAFSFITMLSHLLNGYLTAFFVITGEFSDKISEGPECDLMISYWKKFNYSLQESRSIFSLFQYSFEKSEPAHRPSSIIWYVTHFREPHESGTRCLFLFLIRKMRCVCDLKGSRKCETWGFELIGWDGWDEQHLELITMFFNFWFLQKPESEKKTDWRWIWHESQLTICESLKRQFSGDTDTLANGSARQRLPALFVPQLVVGTPCLSRHLRVPLPLCVHVRKHHSHRIRMDCFDTDYRPLFGVVPTTQTSCNRKETVREMRSRVGQGWRIKPTETMIQSEIEFAFIHFQKGPASDDCRVLCSCDVLNSKILRSSCHLALRDANLLRRHYR